MAALSFLAAALLLGGCGPDQPVAVETLSLPPVSKKLMAPPKAPRCDYAERETVTAAEIQASKECWKAASSSNAARLLGLQAAVSQREAAIARAKAAAKK